MEKSGSTDSFTSFAGRVSLSHFPLNNTERGPQFRRLKDHREALNKHWYLDKAAASEQLMGRKPLLGNQLPKQPTTFAKTYCKGYTKSYLQSSYRATPHLYYCTCAFKVIQLATTQNEVLTKISCKRLTFHLLLWINQWFNDCQQKRTANTKGHQLSWEKLQFSLTACFSMHNSE